MKPENPTQRRARYARACQHLIPLGWEPRGWMLFEKEGRLYDLSAADLTQIDRIEREGLFRSGG